MWRFFLSLSLSQIKQSRHSLLSRVDTGSFSSEVVAKIICYGKPVAGRIEHHRKLDRCMSRLCQLINDEEQQGKSLQAGTVVLADTLSRSTGRFERYWHAPEGGIWLAMVWPDILLSEFSRILPFAVGLACCRAVRAVQVDARLKWVNDIVVCNKKIGGILCETVLSPAGDRYHIMGVGINCNNREFPDELQKTVTSVAQELGTAIDLSDFAGCLLAELNWTLGLLHYDEELALAEQKSCRDQRQSLVLESWLRWSDTIGRSVEYGFNVQEEPLYYAIVKGLDPCGGLILELPGGLSVTEFSGEIRYL